MFGLFKKIKFLETLLLFLLSLTPLLWLKDGYVIFGHDSGLRLNPLQFWENLFYSWNRTANLGLDWSQFKGFLIAQFPEVIFSLLTGSIDNGQKIIFIFWFFVIGISMYTLVNSLYPEKKFWFFRVFASVFYMYNFFLLQGWIIAERAKFSIFAALPLGLLVLYKTLSKEYSLLKGAVLFSFIFFFLNAGGSMPIFGSIFLTYGLTIIYMTILNFIENGPKEIFFSLKLMLSFTAGFLLINAYWTLPQINLIFTSYNFSLTAMGGIGNIIFWADEISKNASIMNVLRLQGFTEWYNNPTHPYSNPYLNNPLFISFSFFPVAIISLGFLLKKTIKEKDDKLIYLVLIFLIIGAIFTTGSHPPFRNFYIFLVESIPGFAIFRSPLYKFGPAVWFSIIFLTGYFLNLILLKFVRQKFTYSILGFFFIISIVVYHFPFFQTKFFMWNQPFTSRVKIPEYVYEMSNYIDRQTMPTARILLLPPVDPVYGNDSYEWNYWSGDTLLELTSNRSIVARANIDVGIPNRITRNIYSAITNNNEAYFLYLTRTYGINKILWRDDILYSDGKTSSKDFVKLNEKLKRLSSVQLEKRVGEWSLYGIQSTNLLPLVYVPKSVTTSDLQIEEFWNSNYNSRQETLISYADTNNVKSVKNVNTPIIQFKMVNPTKYTISVSNAANNYVLVFNEAFNRHWKANVGEEIPEEKHFLVNGYVNGWLISKKGSYRVVLEYFPQKVVYMGAFISLVSFLFGTLIYFRKTKTP